MAAKHSAGSHRISAYSCDIRWRMVYQHLGTIGLSCRAVANNLNVDPSTVSRIARRFEATGDVEPTPKKGVRTKLCKYDEFVIVDSLLERPSMYLHEVQQKVWETTGTPLDESTICRLTIFLGKSLALWHCNRVML